MNIPEISHLKFDIDKFDGLLSDDRAGHSTISFIAVLLFGKDLFEKMPIQKHSRRYPANLHYWTSKSEINSSANSYLQSITSVTVKLFYRVIALSYTTTRHAQTSTKVVIKKVCSNLSSNKELVYS